MRNLKAEMARRGISITDIQVAIGCSYKTAANKINGITEFTFPEALKVRSALFRDLDLEYLFAADNEVA